MGERMKVASYTAELVEGRVPASLIPIVFAPERSVRKTIGWIGRYRGRDVTGGGRVFVIFVAEPGEPLPGPMFPMSPVGWDMTGAGMGAWALYKGEDEAGWVRNDLRRV